PEVAKLDLADLTDAKAKGVMTQLRTMQRTLAIGEHPTRAQKLLDAGYHTATRTALATQTELMEKARLAEREAMQALDRAHTESASRQRMDGRPRRAGRSADDQRHGEGTLFEITCRSTDRAVGRNVRFC